jgi:hypothetical protein
VHGAPMRENSSAGLGCTSEPQYPLTQTGPSDVAWFS